jgi:hypothetical protein
LHRLPPDTEILSKPHFVILEKNRHSSAVALLVTVTVFLVHSCASTAADIAKITVICRGAEEGQVYFVDMASFPVADNRGWKLPPVPHHKDHIFICQLFTPTTLFAPNKKKAVVPLEVRDVGSQRAFLLLESTQFR